MNFSPNDHLQNKNCIFRNNNKENIKSARLLLSDSKKELNQLTQAKFQGDSTKSKLLYSQEDLKNKSFIKQFLLPINIIESIESNSKETLEDQFNKVYRKVKLENCANFDDRMNFDTYKRKTKYLRLEALRLKKSKNVPKSVMKEIVERLQKHEDKCIQKVIQASQSNVTKNKENKVNSEQAEVFYQKEKLFVINKKKRIEKQRHILHLQEDNENDEINEVIPKTPINIKQVKECVNRLHFDQLKKEEKIKTLVEQKLIMEENELKKLFKPNLIKNISRLKNSDWCSHKTMEDVRKQIPNKTKVNAENSNIKATNTNDIIIMKETYKQFHNFQKQHNANQDRNVEDFTKNENLNSPCTFKKEPNKIKNIPKLIDYNEKKKNILNKDTIENIKDTNLEKIGEENFEDIEDVKQEMVDKVNFNNIFNNNKSEKSNNSFELNDKELIENEIDLNIKIQQIREANPIRTLNNLYTTLENSINYNENSKNLNSKSNCVLINKKSNEQLRAFDIWRELEFNSVSTLSPIIDEKDKKEKILNEENSLKNTDSNFHGYLFENHNYFTELSDANSKSDVNFTLNIKKDKNLISNSKFQKPTSLKNDSYEKIIIESIRKKNIEFQKNRNA